MRSYLNRMRSAVPSLQWFEVCLWVLLILAIVVRVMKLPLMEFKGDEFAFLTESFRNPLNLERIHGIRSAVPIPHPPMFAYLLAIPTSLTVSPVAITAYVVGLNLLGLWFLYLFCKQVFSRDIALPVTTLVASMPWAIIFSRKIWNPDIVIPCMMLFLLAFAWLIKEYKPWKLYLFTAALAVFLQAHLLLMFSIVLVVAVLWMSNLPIEREHLVKATILLFILHLPYLAYAFGAGSDSVGGYVGGQMNAGIRIDGIIDNFLWWLRTSTGMEFSYLLGQSGHAAFSKSVLVSAAEGIFAIFALVAIVAYVWCLQRACKSLLTSGRMRLAPYKLMMLFMLLWSIFLFVLLSVTRVQSVPHYWVSSIFILPFCTVVFMQSMCRHLLPIAQQVVHGCFVILVASNIVFMLSFYSFLENHSEKITGDYGTPFQFEKDVWIDRLEASARQLNGR